MQLLLLFSLVLVRCCLVLAVAVALLVLKPFIFRTRLGAAHEHPCQAKYTHNQCPWSKQIYYSKVLFRYVSLSLQKWRIQTAWFYFISFNSWAKLQKMSQCCLSGGGILQCQLNPIRNFNQNTVYLNCRYSEQHFLWSPGNQTFAEMLYLTLGTPSDGQWTSNLQNLHLP